jgi:uncharacterized membrane protein YphA (DoxX/SURF4 family)
MKSRIRTIAYWTFTFPLVYENAAGAIWVLLQVEYPRMVLAHLEYPQYLQYILGPWELACAAALLAPRLPRVKEWAYAGAFFKYSAAFVSHLYVGVDRPEFGAAVSSAVMAVLTVISWALRPSDRRFPKSMPVGETPASSWIISAIILSLMLILSLFTLPK